MFGHYDCLLNIAVRCTARTKPNNNTSTNYTKGSLFMEYPVLDYGDLHKTNRGNNKKFRGQLHVAQRK